MSLCVSLSSLRSSEACFLACVAKGENRSEASQCSLDRVFPRKMKTGEEREKVPKQEQGKKESGWFLRNWMERHSWTNEKSEWKWEECKNMCADNKERNNCQNSLNCRVTGALRSLRPLTDFYEAPVWKFICKAGIHIRLQWPLVMRSPSPTLHQRK